MCTFRHDSFIFMSFSCKNSIHTDIFQLVDPSTFSSFSSKFLKQCKINDLLIQNQIIYE